MASEERTDEDKIIEILKIEGMVRQYEDLDFLPVRQSLYEEEDQPPMYDEFIAPQMVWCRPQEIDPTCQYFADDYVSPRVSAGTLPDETFASTLMAVCSYQGYDLLETIIASRPDDFKIYGVISCRFYVEGEWVEVITDTRLPCVRNELTLQQTPAYSKSPNSGEMWVALLEKAYAKAVGSYEAIQKIKLHETLLHLTGGSIQQYFTADGEGVTPLWTTVMNIFQEENVLVMARPNQDNEEENMGMEAGLADVHNMDGEDGDRPSTPPVASPSASAPSSPDRRKEKSADANFRSNRTYVLASYLDFSTFHLVCVFDAWRDVEWSGAWCNDSGKWDDFPELMHAAEVDTRTNWTREDPDSGYMWMTLEDFKGLFCEVTACKLFPNEKFKYYRMLGEWSPPEERISGPLSTVQDKHAAVKQANEARVASSMNSTAAYSIDADASWFNNPQTRIFAKEKATVSISVVPITGDGEAAPTPSINVAVTADTADQSHIWDFATAKIVSNAELSRGLPLAKGQESSIWHLNIEPNMIYHIIPSCAKKTSYGPFVVRIFSPNFLNVERMPPVRRTVLESYWKRTTTQDTAGGPPTLVDATAKTGFRANSKWSQNPQFHVNLIDKFSRKDVHLKLVLRRKDKPAKTTKGSAPETISFVVCKADCLEDLQPLRKKGGGPRQNALGEVIPSKESSLRRKKVDRSEVAPTQASRESGKTILRRTAPPKDAFALVTTGTSKTEATAYFPLLPRSWCANGLLVVPSLAYVGNKGNFALEVYSSEPVDVTEMPEQFMKSVASDWTEILCGGSHICEMWKKNPRFIMKLLSNDVSRQPVKMRITLSRCGDGWDHKCRADAVGNMIGFYIFRTNMGQQELVYEGNFVPDKEVSTDSDFQLEPLDENEDYIILASTFAEGKQGAFVLNIMADCEVSLTKGDAGR